MRSFGALTGWMHRSTAMLGFTIGMAFSAASAAIIPLTIEEMVAHSDDVVSGRVAAEQDTMFVAGKIFTVSHFIVEESYKGTHQPNDVIPIAVPGGEIGAITQMATNIAKLQPNEEVVLFLDSPDAEMMAAAAQARSISPEHPVLTSSRIIGGTQGKFHVIKREEVATVNGQATIKEVNRVTREVVGRRPKVEDFPSTEDFGSAIRRIAAGQVPVRHRVQVFPNSAPVDIAERDPDARALRIFDPISAGPAPTKSVDKLPEEPEGTRDPVVEDGPVKTP
jgi:hypothetical protein